jgi:hypothetical protein
MPFSTDVKTQMFIRCHRRCCLCWKQCGINMEAAHIIDESAGGSNDGENGIPLCFDCHQEIGSYNEKHPKGNKIRPDELRARRDYLYKLMEEGKFADQAPITGRTPSLANPLHRIIDLLTKYHNAMDRVRHANTQETRLTSLDEWRSCHPAIWGKRAVRDDTIRSLADPAKEWLSQINCRYVHAEDFNRVEEAACVLSGFAVSPGPMSMPDVYSKTHDTEAELWKQWKREGEQCMALHALIVRLKELAGRAGQRWNPDPQAK